MPDLISINTDDGDPADNAAKLIERLWKDWLALLDQYDGRDTAVTDSLERLQVQFGLHARILSTVKVSFASAYHRSLEASFSYWG